MSFASPTHAGLIDGLLGCGKAFLRDRNQQFRRTDRASQPVGMPAATDADYDANIRPDDFGANVRHEGFLKVVGIGRSVLDSHSRLLQRARADQNTSVGYRTPKSRPSQNFRLRAASCPRLRPRLARPS